MSRHARSTRSSGDHPHVLRGEHRRSDCCGVRQHERRRPGDAPSCDGTAARLYGTRESGVIMAACAQPISSADVFDYWAGELESRDQERIEEHVFTCAACAATLAEGEAL